MPGGQAGGYYATLCAFNLFRMRQQTNEPEVGVEVHDLELGPKLGEGGYGVVHLARHRVSGTLFAVKSFTKAKIRRIEERTTYMRLERERKTLRLMQARLTPPPPPPPHLTPTPPPPLPPSPPPHPSSTPPLLIHTPPHPHSSRSSYCP